MKDVYGGDDALPRPGGGLVRTYLIQADGDPDVVARVAQTLALANRAPEWFTMREDATTGSVSIVARLPTADATQADYIQRKLQQLTSVRTVDSLD